MPIKKSAVGNRDELLNQLQRQDFAGGERQSMFLFRKEVIRSRLFAMVPKTGWYTVGEYTHTDTHQHQPERDLKKWVWLSLYDESRCGAAVLMVTIQSTRPKYEACVVPGGHRLIPPDVRVRTEGEGSKV